MERFTPSDRSGEERYELEAAFGEDAELVDLTEDLRAAAEEDEED